MSNYKWWREFQVCKVLCENNSWWFKRASIINSNTLLTVMVWHNNTMCSYNTKHLIIDFFVYLRVMSINHVYLRIHIAHLIFMLWRHIQLDNQRNNCQSHPIMCSAHPDWFSCTRNVLRASLLSDANCWLTVYTDYWKIHKRQCFVIVLEFTG